MKHDMYVKDGISLIHGDSLQALKGYGDNHFDIAIVDPLYGIGISSNPFRQKHEKCDCDWDNAIPNKQYFDELMRVSKNQIIWGGNYFDLPVELYRWLLEMYTSEGDLVLDTHLGSGSIAIACHYMKRKLIGYEIDADYYRKACKRFEEQTRQIALW